MSTLYLESRDRFVEHLDQSIKKNASPSANPLANLGLDYSLCTSLCLIHVSLDLTEGVVRDSMCGRGMFSRRIAWLVKFRKVVLRRKILCRRRGDIHQVSEIEVVSKFHAAYERSSHFLYYRTQAAERDRSVLASKAKSVIGKGEGANLKYSQEKSAPQKAQTTLTSSLCTDDL